MSTLGIIAGGGGLPVAVAQSAREAGRAVFIVALLGAADRGLETFPHEWVSLGEAKKLLAALRKQGCKDVIFAGRVARPKFSELRTDSKGLLLLPRIVAAARKGDDALLRLLADILGEEGFRTVGIAEATPGLLVPDAVLGRIEPGKEERADIARAADVVRRLGELDVGQAAVVADGLVLAVEAAEGTDAMLARVAELPETIRGSATRRRGVLVKALKPTQDGKTDLPVIGIATVRNAAAAGLAGIAVEAHFTLVLDRSGVVAAADSSGLFILGFVPGTAKHE